jgi:hypothetical protein
LSEHERRAGFDAPIWVREWLACSRNLPAVNLAGLPGDLASRIRKVAEMRALPASRHSAVPLVAARSYVFLARTRQEVSMTGIATPESEPGTYTAIVHFHGMGSQRRLEETSRIIDALDSFQYSEFKTGRPLGFFRKIEPRLIPPDPVDAEPDAYIRATFFPPQEAPPRNLRFHEAYWAPIMADEKSALSIALWLVAQWRRPFQTLLTPWRQRQRLRRARLIDLFESYPARLPHYEESDLTTLITLYDAFESPEARRGPSKGSFGDFLNFIERDCISDRDKPEPVRCARLQSVARAWRRHYVRTEFGIVFLLTTVILIIALAAAAVLVGAFVAANAVLGLSGTIPVLAKYVPLLGEAGSIAMLFVTGLLSLAGITSFLKSALGDVRAWASYRETDIGNRKRQEILVAARRTMARVLSDPKCERVVVTAHSLGTTIAHDTLLSLTRANRALNRENPIEGPLPLIKIEHFITWGSPIDKVEYFFESSTSTSHRYLRVQEILRGDTGGPPFARNRKPHIHWINFWDDGDLVSGPLSSPMPAQRSINPIDNFHVKGFAFPLPGASHTGYLAHRPVVSRLWDVIIDRGLSYVALKNDGDNGELGKDYRSVLIRPGKGRGDRRWMQLLSIGVPWCLVVTLLLSLFAGISPLAGMVVTAACALLLAVLAIRSIRAGPLTPY